MQAQYIEINKEGDKFYYKDREMKTVHRADGPAVEYANGTKCWCIDGQYHRTDGPAIENADGCKRWYINDKLHRTDGPAIEYAGGHKEWFFNGKRHREDGPAVEYVGGHKEWRLDGKRLTEEQFNFRTAPEVVLTLDEIAAKLGIDVSKLKIVKEH